MQSSSKNILIIDDDDVMRQKIKRILSATSYNITEAASGQEAQEILATKEFDCVMLDYRLGDIDGIELISAINTDDKAPCPIIMITGMGDEKLAVEAMRRGAYDYIKKDNLQAEHLLNVISAGIKWAEVEGKLQESQKKLEYLSMYDSLTSLPNRQLLLDRLEHALSISRRDESKFAVLMMDLNLFKEVNDSLGHAAGDELLIQVAQRLKKLSRESDTFARLGGDEFCGILYHMRSLEDACSVAEKINLAIKEPFMLKQGESVNIGISIGIAYFEGQKTDVKSLLAQADSSMYEAKKGSLGYSTHVNGNESFAKLNPALMISSCLSQSLDNGEFYMVYQPQVDLVTGECCGVEALARWNSPVLGNIPPDVFVKIAERSDIISKLTYATFEMTFKQAKAWENEKLLMPISLNLSAKLLDDKDLILSVSSLLAKHKVFPELVTLEITETALMHSPHEASQAIQKLSDMGIQISIDDFGTGFTSFTHLRHFALNELKIDKLFIKDLKQDSRDSSIVHSFVSLANGFGIKLVAEGVEDGEKLDMLKAAGCTKAQGYWISRPIEGDQIPEWLEDWNMKRNQPKQRLRIAI
jgi:diguanylate cyclase (GGDEF)-like protein